MAAVLLSSQTDVAGPCAFDIRLGINTGSRSSPECDLQTVGVNADTTVNWIFRQGAYVFNHVHGRDMITLQKDFDLYLIRPGRDDIVLNQNRVIADYKIEKNDRLMLRHKTLPIPIHVSLYEGDTHKIEVNSGFPLMDIVPNICQKLGIKIYEELSIALPSSGPGGDTMQYEWLDFESSLNGQGVKEGDMLLLRKKFFIINDDIKEAIDGNEVMMEMLYRQILSLYTTENYIGSGSENISDCAKLSALFHHVEQTDENISDEESVYKMMPKHLRKESEFYEKTVTAYYSERVGTLPKLKAKRMILEFFSFSQSIIVNYFPVKKSQGSEDLVLSVDSDQIKICRKINKQQELKNCEGMSWRLRDLRDTESTSSQLRVNILGSWYEFVTDHRKQIACYLGEAQALIKLRVAIGRHVSVSSQNKPEVVTVAIQNKEADVFVTSGADKSATNMVEPTSLVGGSRSPVLTNEPTATIDNEPAVNTDELATNTAEPMANTDEPAANTVANTDEPAANTDEPTANTDEPTANTDEPTANTDEPTANTNEPGAKTDEPGANTDEPGANTDEPILLVGVSQSLVNAEPISKSPNVERNTSGDKLEVGDIDDALGTGGNSSTNDSTSDSIHNEIPQGATPTHRVNPPTESIPSPQSEEIKVNLASPAKSISGRSTYVHIPDYLGMDYRQVLEDYRLFHIVVMKQDIRAVMLNINKPVQEVVDSLCGTFDVPNPTSCYLWIPTGIQSIIEKYGGKPKRGVNGKFVKQQQNGRDFAPRLNVSKTIKQQYNFTIKPFLLHLRRYQAEEGVDAPDDLDCGTEWPVHENPDVARYRKFYQSWVGIVQGAFPIEKKGAVKLAALLTQIYYGDREKAQYWPPSDYSPRIFLPEEHKNSFGIASEVEKSHRELAGKMSQECINDVIEGCRKLSTMRGVFFEVSMPVKSEILAVIPWNKMEKKWFGVNKLGIFGIEKSTGETTFTHKLSDVSKWSATENSFKLTFREQQSLDGYTYQAKEILDTLELFVQLLVKERRDEERRSTTPSSQTFNNGTPVKHANNGRPVTDSAHKTPLNLNVEIQQSMQIQTKTFEL